MLKKAGFEITRSVANGGVLIKGNEFGWDSFQDMTRLVKSNSQVTIIDVGANIGQSTQMFLSFFPNAIIHSFEPGPVAFKTLSSNFATDSRVHAWNFGVASSSGTLDLVENSNSDMSSFLSPGKMSWGNVAKKTQVPIVSLDEFTEQNGIGFIHILKSDTQGFDFEVLKGANTLLSNHRIGILRFEFIFSEMYSNLPSFDEVFCFLSKRGYELVSFYDICYQNHVVSWLDAVFISAKYKEENLYNNNHVVFSPGKNPFK